jgi:hypothetical protein
METLEESIINDINYTQPTTMSVKQLQVITGIADLNPFKITTEELETVNSKLPKITEMMAWLMNQPEETKEDDKTPFGFEEFEGVKPLLEKFYQVRLNLHQKDKQNVEADQYMQKELLNVKENMLKDMEEIIKNL